MNDTARALIIAARATNLRRTEDEQKAGFASPHQGPPDMTIRTVMCALMCGMETNDWAAVAEAYDMLCTTHRAMTGKNYDPVCG